MHLSTRLLFRHYTAQCAHLRHVLHAGARSATAHAQIEGDIVQIFGAKLSELKDLNLYCARCQTFKSRILY